MTTHDQYYVPEGSKWPIIASSGVLTLLAGIALAINGINGAVAMIIVGLVIMAILFFGWFSEVIHESREGYYNEQVDSSFRQGMMWFIGSEVFFFACFFGSYYYLREITLPYLGGEGHLGKTNMLWEGFKSTWPLLDLPATEGIRGHYIEAKEAMGAWGIPALNTAILLSSGGTLTWAHWGLKNNNRKQLKIGLALTIILGVTFFLLQVKEYGHAYTELHLTLQSGLYGSIFYLLTGFHGFHVVVGAIMLMAIFGRALKGHFSPHNHFAFEAVAWYWHFVDVVWLGLFIFVYWL